MTYDELESLTEAGKAIIEQDIFNYRVFAYDGVRYFCGWESPCAREHRAGGWVIYKQGPLWFKVRLKAFGTTWTAKAVEGGFRVLVNDGRVPQRSSALVPALQFWELFEEIK